MVFFLIFFLTTKKPCTTTPFKIRSGEDFCPFTTRRPARSKHLTSTMTMRGLSVGIVKFAWRSFAVLPTYIFETAIAAT